MQRTHQSVLVISRPADIFQDSCISLNRNSSLPETTRRLGKEETNTTDAHAQSNAGMPCALASRDRTDAST